MTGVRLEVVAAALSGRPVFGADAPLDDRVRAAVAALRRRRDASGQVPGRAVVGPEPATIETAELLGFDAVVEPALSEPDMGDWIGLAPADVPLDALARWRADPDAAPHGGESATAARSRAAAWMSGYRGGVDAVIAGPAVVRMLVLECLDAPAGAMWTLDIAPLATVRLTRAPGGPWRTVIV